MMRILIVSVYIIQHWAVKGRSVMGFIFLCGWGPWAHKKRYLVYFNFIFELWALGFDAYLFRLGLLKWPFEGIREPSPHFHSMPFFFFPLPSKICPAWANLSLYMLKKETSLISIFALVIYSSWVHWSSTTLWIPSPALRS
jgi:hypothetical protein